MGEEAGGSSSVERSPTTLRNSFEEQRCRRKRVIEKVCVRK